MHNTELPHRAELPSTARLVRSTAIAAVSAVVLLLAVVLPAEYGVDPTGIGRLLGLTEMGEIKTRLAREAAADAAAARGGKAAAPDPASAPIAAGQASIPPARPASDPASPAQAGPAWRDEMSFTLAPGQGTEIKLRMSEGDKAAFAWTVQGGVVNYDTHGDAPGRSISYVKGRAVAADEGVLVAAFSGNHGWFWRNRGQAEVTVVLRTGGTYQDIKRVK
jgi:hypothetical protein